MSYYQVDKRGALYFVPERSSGTTVYEITAGLTRKSAQNKFYIEAATTAEAKTRFTYIYGLTVTGFRALLEEEAEKVFSQCLLHRIKGARHYKGPALELISFVHDGKDALLLDLFKDKNGSVYGYCFDEDKQTCISIPAETLMSETEGWPNLMLKSVLPSFADCADIILSA